MVENNAFRLYMLIGGVIASGLVMACIYLYPVKPVPEQTKISYERVMNETFVDDPKSPDDRIIRDVKDPNYKGVSLTTYEMMTFYLKGMVRGNTRHY